MPDNERLTSAITGRKGTRRRQSGREPWLDFHCPVHDDRHRSASYQPDTGSLVCRVCGKLDQETVLRILGRELAPDRRSDQDHSARASRVLLSTSEWPYYWPNFEISHYKVRQSWSAPPFKTYFQRSPLAGHGLPDPCWPLYGDTALTPGSHLLLVEGELCVDAVSAQQANIQGIPVAALTAGSAADLSKASELLVKRLRELAPASLVLWPDNDEPGFKAMARVSTRLQQAGIQHVILDPERLGLGVKEDVVDYLETGATLADLVHREISVRSRPLVNARDVAARIQVLVSGLAVLPDSQFTFKPDVSWSKTIWQKVIGTQASTRQAEELLTLLRLKAAEDPSPEHWRLRSDGDCVYWRPGPCQPVYRVSAAGIDREPDIPDGILLCAGTSFRPDTVNLDDEGQALEMVCGRFGLTGHEHDMVEAWLVAALTGQETPILLLRGEAGAGKSTLARWLVSLIDPVQPELDGSARIMDDQRQLVRSLQRSPVALMDNVTSLPASVEDLLCKLVTGYSVSLRTLYSDSPETIRMRRAMVITTIGWEAYRGDLSSRMVVMQVRRDTEEFESEEDVTTWLDARMPAARGWIMKRAAEHFANRRQVSSQFRVGALGRVLHSLGRDLASIHADESAAKAAILNQNDAWFQAVVAVWRQYGPDGDFMVATSQLVDMMIEKGVSRLEAPAPSSKKFAAWLSDKSFMFRDHGFHLQHARTSSANGWWFRRVRPFQVVRSGA